MNERAYEFLFYWLQFTGLFPRPIRSQLHHQEITLLPKWNILAVFWSAFLFCIPVLQLFISYSTYAVMDKDALQRLEFFTLIRLAFLMYIFLQAVLISLTFNTNSQQMLALYGTLAFSNKSSSSNTTLVLLSVWNVVYVTSWTLSIYAIFAFTVGHYFDSNWHLEVSALEIWKPEFKVPVFVVCLYMMLAAGVSASCEIVPQSILLYAVLGIRSTFRSMQHVVSQLRTTSQKERKAILEELDDLDLQYRVQQILLHDLDGCFAGTMLVTLIKDLVALAAVLGFLYTSRDQRLFSITEMADKTVMWIVGGISLVNAIFKLAVCISCHEQVVSLRETLLLVGNHFSGSVIQSRCDDLVFFSKMQDCGISVGGFLKINREFIPSLVGIVLGYAVLIYQTHDTKLDIRTLLSKHDFVEFSAQLGHCLTGNATMD